ncbi:peptide chain release factor N(5)-glutamine methyltransferase [Candidatus Peregrinibacteria bacterium]|nr:peptide chain release factor N(5)-glutamine methyltransferase [Candidatus Peregrinibacteria bacterium]
MDPLDIEVLKAHVLKKDRSWVVAHPEYVLTKREQLKLEDCLKRRRAGEPVAYITGEKEFYGRMFFVDSRVLIPRPSTEGLIEMVLEKPKVQIIKTIDEGIIGTFIQLQRTNEQVTTLVDIGTGSGCIAITLTCERSDARIIATDINADALEVAKENAKRHNVLDRVEFRKGNLLEPVMDLNEPFIIVSNPPYVSKDSNNPHLNPLSSKGEEKFYEPPLALFAGPKGTDVLIPLVEQAKKHPYCMGVFLECQEDQIPLLSNM